MKPTRKRASFPDLLADASSALKDLLITGPMQGLKDARERFRDLPKSNFELGQKFAEQGQWFDALFRFRIVKRFWPNTPFIDYHLASCYYRMGKQEDARVALKKALHQHPHHEPSLVLASMLDPSLLPAGYRLTALPKTMVSGFFTSIAKTYDLEEARHQYQAGNVLHPLLLPFVASPHPVVVDLGCGTGIAARPWRKAASHITGVDFTPAMLRLADSASHAEKKLFDQIIEADIVGTLPDSLPRASADLVLVVNSLPYIGDPTPVLRNAQTLLKPGGIVAVTTDTSKASAGFTLSAESGRFTHSAGSVKQAATHVGLVSKQEATVALYKGTPSTLFIFENGNA